MKGAAFTIFSLFFASVIFGQSTEDDVRQLFGSSANVLWVEHYKGRQNDINDLAMTLGYDGRTCKGFIWYLRSKARFRVEGSIGEDMALKLTEYDSLGRATGLILGTINHAESIEGSWVKTDKSVSEPLRLMSMPHEPRYPSHCGDNKWIRKYEGNIDAETVELLLIRGNDGQLKGTVFYTSQRKTHLVEGQFDGGTRQVTLNIQDLNLKSIAQISGKIDFATDKITGKTATGKPCSLDATQLWDVHCSEYADFLTKTEVTFPKTTNQKLNDLLNDKVEKWRADAKKYSANYLRKKSSLTVADRTALRSYGWYELDYASDKFISGKLFFSNTWESDFQIFAFNYDLVNNKSLTTASIFKENFDYQKVIKTYIDKEVKKRPYYGDGFYDGWIKTQKFEHFTVCKGGFVFSTNFNSIYGQQQVIIPFELLLPYLKDSDSFLEAIN